MSGLDPSSSRIEGGLLRGCRGVAQGLPEGTARKAPGKCIEEPQNIRIKPYSIFTST
jgi:hypothetical protein